MRRRPAARRDLWVAAALAVASCMRSDPAAAGKHRLRAPPQVADRHIAEGAILVADYGAFRVVDVAPEAMPAAPPDESFAEQFAEWSLPGER